MTSPYRKQAPQSEPEPGTGYAEIVVTTVFLGIMGCLFFLLVVVSR